MKILINIIFAMIVTSSIVYGQNMWFRGNISPGSLHMMRNLSVDSIKQIVATDSVESQNHLYPAAVEYLYFIHQDAEFLLDNLSSEVDTSEAVSENSTYWNKVYTNIFFRGLLGDNSAIEKMRTIANHATYYARMIASRALAQVGIYDNYSFVREGYEEAPILFINLLAWYGRDSRYTDEVKSIIMDKIDSASTISEIYNLASNLNVFSNDGTLLLNNYFQNKTGEERYKYFFELGIIDKNNQPERSFFALQSETDDALRAKYLPNPFEVLNNGFFYSNRYLEPWFINSLNQLSISDTNSLTYRSKNSFLFSFMPSHSDSLKSTIDLLSDLYSYADSVFYYTWLGDQQFKDELQSILQSAKTNLQNGDSLACRVQVKAIQDLVDNVYKDSLNADPRFVTIEGWKFLYWNAQYILDRLLEQ